MLEQEMIIVDSKDMLLFVMKKWWLICIMMILGAGILGAYEYVRTPQLSVKESAGEDSQLSLEEMKAKLSESQIADVDEILEKYNQADVKLDEIDNKIMSIDGSTSEEVSELKRLVAEQSNWITYKKNLEGMMSNDQKQYFEAILEGPNTEESEEQTYEKKSVWKKTCIGGAVGILIGLTVIMLFYMHDGKVKSEKELKCMYHLDVLDSVKSGKNTDVGKLLLENIDILLDKNASSSLFLVFEQNNAEAKYIVNSISKALTERNDDIILKIGDPLVKQQALRDFVRTDTVLLIVQLKKTQRNDLMKQLDLCERFEKTLIGAVIID